MTNVCLGTISGDGECWCIKVSEAEYRRIKGDNDADLELEIHNEMYEELNQEPEEKEWLIYPNDLINEKHLKMN